MPRSDRRRNAAGPFASVDLFPSDRRNASAAIEFLSRITGESADERVVEPRGDFRCGPRLAARARSHREPHVTRPKTFSSILGAAMDGAALGVAMVAMVLLVGWFVLP